MNETQTKPDVYTLVTDRIIEQLKLGTIPWKKPWVDGGIPRNLLTNIPYRGINVWMLASLDYADNLFLTWKQAKEIGASVKRGEKASLVVFWKMIDKDDQPKKKSVLRYFWVFNIAQCEDIPERLISPYTPTVFSVGDSEKIIAEMPEPPAIKHVKSKAFYEPAADCINIPKIKSFTNPESYYTTLYHELVHSSGHEKRLNRKELVEMAAFGTQTYSIEELTAEIGACYLNSYAGIKAPIDNNVAYINGWLEKLQNDKRYIVYASSQAQRAVDHILRIDVGEKKVQGIE